jgi:hypothetical protein
MRTDTRIAQRPRRHAISVGVLTGAAALAMCLPAGANAATGTGSWNCSSSALEATLLNQAPIHPIVANANHASCETDSAGVNNLGPSIFNLVGADAANAITTVDGSAAPADQTPLAYATVANVSLTNIGTALIELPGTLSSEVTAKCVNGAPKFSATSTTAPLEIAGKTIPTDKPLTEVLAGVGSLTGAVLTVNPGQETQTADSVTRDALHVQLHLGSTSILDVVLAQSTVSLSGTPCSDTTASGSGSGSGSGTGTSANSTTTKGGSGSGTGSNGSGGSSNGSSGANGGTNTTLGEDGIGASYTYLLNELKAGFDQFGARVESTKPLSKGSKTRVRIGCWRKHTGNCNIRVLVFRLPSAKLVGSKHLSIRPGHIKMVVISTPHFRRFPVFVHLMKG